MGGVTVSVLSFSYYPAENLIEYKWPPDEAGEYYMLQEQVSEYLGVTSFKRKYPGTESQPAPRRLVAVLLGGSPVSVTCDTTLCVLLLLGFHPPCPPAPLSAVHLLFCLIHGIESEVRKQVSRGKR